MGRSGNSCLGFTQRCAGGPHTVACVARRSSELLIVLLDFNVFALDCITAVLYYDMNDPINIISYYTINVILLYYYYTSTVLLLLLLCCTV